jgi:hypothetical protein
MIIRHHDTAHSRDRRWSPRLVRLSPWKASADGPAWIHDWGNRAGWAAVAVSVLLFIYAVVYAFPNARLIVEQQERDAIEHGNRAFCEKHGMPFGTREHTLCVEDLMDIRASDRQSNRAYLGILLRHRCDGAL